MIVALYDTNIYISGTFWRGAPRQALHLAQLGVVEVVTCEQLFTDFSHVHLQLPKVGEIDLRLPAEI